MPLKQWPVAFASLVILFWPIPCPAAGGGTVRILSNGNKTCGAFLKNNVQGKQLDLAWVSGFVSGLNYGSNGQRRRVGERWERDAEQNWIENYCTGDPLASLFEAANAFREELARKEGIAPTE